MSLQREQYITGDYNTVQSWIEEAVMLFLGVHVDDHMPCWHSHCLQPIHLRKVPVTLRRTLKLSCTVSMHSLMT